MHPFTARIFETPEVYQDCICYPEIVNEHERQKITDKFQVIVVIRIPLMVQPDGISTDVQVALNEEFGHRYSLIAVNWEKAHKLIHV